jgi:hypothetical protein
MTSIIATISRLKAQLPEFLAPALILDLLGKLSVTFRQRVLPPVLVVQLLVLRILEGNTAYTHLPHLAGTSFTASAFCQALGRLPLELLQMLLAFAAQTDAANATALFFGHRVLVIDAVCVSMPDTPELAKHYGYGTGQRPGLGFPVAKLLMLLDLSTGLIRRVLVNPFRTHELSRTHKLHPELAPGDILLGDRAFASFVHLALLLAQSCHGVFRAHQRLAWKIATPSKGHMRGRILRTLNREDRLVVYRKPGLRPVWISVEDYAALPDEITVRELRYHVSRKGFRSRTMMLVTTLRDPQRYPRLELARLYGLRWQIETQFRHLKSTLNMDVLKGKSVAIVEREILAYVLVFNLLTREIRHAAVTFDAAPDRLSFLDAVRWILTGMGTATRLLINPLRPGRVEPRVRKRRMVNYPYMTRPRDVLKKELLRDSEKLARLT